MTTRRDFLKAAAVIPFLGTQVTTGAATNRDESPAAERLRVRCEQSLRERYADQPERRSISLSRLNHELEVIHRLTLDEYFLTLWDIARYARKEGHSVIIHGPAAGSLVAYALRLSSVCPHRHRLLFERFLDAEESTTPTISVLVPQDGQGKVASYTRARCSEQAINVLGVPALSLVNRVSRLLHDKGESSNDRTQLPENDPETLDLFQRGETEGVFQFESRRAQEFLRELRPDRIEDLAAAIALSQNGPSEVGRVKEYVEPRRGRKSKPFPHPIAEEIAEPTRGVLIYQDQIMVLVHRMAGMKLRDGYRLVKAICMWKQERIDGYRQEFIAGARERGINDGIASRIFEHIEKVGGSTFCKAHATAQADLSYRTAFFKAHFAREFKQARKFCDAFSPPGLT